MGSGGREYHMSKGKQTFVAPKTDEVIESTEFTRGDKIKNLVHGFFRGVFISAFAVVARVLRLAVILKTANDDEDKSSLQRSETTLCFRDGLFQGFHPPTKFFLLAQGFF